jgi:NAD(P)-dependent dehydrogenase (short-subunit alcohol dehydrogenase family)
MDLQLKNKTVLITGGSAGIGLACAHLFAAEGCSVAIIAREPDRLATAARTVGDKHGTQVYGISADLASLVGIETSINIAASKLGRIDVLVNNAGSIRAGAFLDIPDAQWIEDWNLKVLGYVRAARHMLPMMIKQGGGRIINVIGTAARQANPNYLVGGAANAALVHFTKGLSEVAAKDGVFVKAASPGAVQTERWENRMKLEAKAQGRNYEEVRAERIAEYPLKRIVTPDEVADLVCFLASPRSDMLNGASVNIDGGWSRGIYP